MKAFRCFYYAALLALLSACVSAGSGGHPRIVAVGDIHGDYSAFEEVMSRAGIIDENGDWSGGTTILVQTGDLADRGPDTLKIIEHMQKLEVQAGEQGGRVVPLVANHEGMNMIGDLRYVHPGEIAAFADDQSEALREQLFSAEKAAIFAAYRSQDPELTEAEIKAQWEERTPLGFVEHRRAWAPDGRIGSWVIGNDVVTVIGDSLFAHGGPSAKYTAYTLDEINTMASDALRAQRRDPGAIINDQLGPLWYRGLLRLPGEVAETGVDGAALTIEAELEIILEHFGVERIIVGHTPSREGIKPNHDGRVIQIDTGMSAHYGGTNSFLEITETAIYANDDGRVTLIEERESPRLRANAQ